MTQNADGRIVPVLLSGGTGSRLWPLSRETYPKQLLALLGERSLLQQTALRAVEPSLFGDITVVTNVEHRFSIAGQLREIGVTDPTMILEPVGRNTAPAIAVAALVAAETNPDAVILAMPVDHWIGDIGAFRAAVARGLDAAREGRFVLFGMRPTAPATGFGYIHIGAPLNGREGTYVVSDFVEKPSESVAEKLVTGAEHLWNSGIFLIPVRLLISELESLAPDVLSAARASLAAAGRDRDCLRLDQASFAGGPAISIDHAVMEQTAHAAVVAADFGWSDVGSWSALWDVAEKDGDNNVAIGDVVMEDARDCYVRGEGPLIAALGVENLVITATSDVVLVASRDRDQDVGKLVSRLKSDGHSAATQTQRVHRPWGYYQSIDTGSRFQVKRITVNPGAKLSLQKHFHRAEHWVVVTGTAIVTRDDEETLLRENESIFVPLGCMHRLENPGKVPLNLIEVQCGSYLGEDDIVRVEDVYQRV
ncbi:mannose-1-phosphate guanylyltransferase/mannose-6-phosphate isomerase [Bradyrhizobium sp. WD16]|uniref:mannose-1-phosphate guanylyltransferase/mannose-6-phosphate isomerase n=1 Tax=Bradyrhizobium sp. WD16 TaxID=1521768 RepID=UPI0020A40684|nr:mannose-1-phosphate guanylyltransferase/mannose-6-phosphate isomerase [Bradyrhizobium sp. WD16]UTD28284.1 mannose-1-phosphate guanylyltransferase/mannose-6-phosphate isomerase [Bradyrhizobium sp. WD16]